MICGSTARVGVGRTQPGAVLMGFHAVGKDFSTFPQNGGKPLTGRPSKDFMISLAMAKELAMVERNDKGKQARLYFIACEQRMLQRAAAQLHPGQYQ